mgnify:CR=1 FL=1
MKTSETLDTPTELRIFKMMISSLHHAGLSPGGEELTRCRSHLCTRFGLAAGAGVNGVIDLIFDEYPTAIAHAFEEILTSLVSTTPGKFPEVKLKIVEDPPEALVNPELGLVEKKFEHLDHTADIQIHSWGENIKEAFGHQILGMFEYMVPLERIVPKTTITLEATAPNDKNLNGKF